MLSKRIRRNWHVRGGLSRFINPCKRPLHFLIRCILQVLNYLYQRVFNGFDMHGVHYGNNQGYQRDNSYHNQPNFYCRQFPVKPWYTRAGHRVPRSGRRKGSALVHRWLLGLLRLRRGGGRRGAFLRICRRPRDYMGLHVVFRHSYGVAAIRTEIASLFNLGVAVRAYHFFTFSSCRPYGAVFAPRGLMYRYKFNLREWTAINIRLSYAAYAKKEIGIK